MTDHRLAYLYEKYRHKTCTYQELEEFLFLANQPDTWKKVVEMVDKDWPQIKDFPKEAGEVDWDFMFNTIVKKSATPGKVVSLKPKSRFFQIGKVAAAAVIILLAGTIGFLMFKNNQDGQQASNDNLKTDKQEEILPGREGAILTLADGKQIVLDTASTGALAQQGNVTVIKLEGHLSYNTEGNSNEVLYNTISTPRGRNYQVELADGTKVWLNAASSLKFPTTFVGKQRVVELTGEGYFEVAHNSDMPFHVNVNPESPTGRDLNVQVLGTHFNINSYNDEAAIKTTLLEGKVMVTKKDKHIYLNPNQQATVNSGQDNIRVAFDVDVEEVVAWKNGYMHFDVADVAAIMRQIARWYDVEVGSTGDLNSVHLTGKVSRNATLSQVIKILEESGIEIKTEGRKLIASPKP